MRRCDNPHQGCASNDSEFADGSLEADELIEEELTELERLLERKEDATLGLAKLRELRRSCGRIKELLGRPETAGAARAQASR